MNDHRKIEMLRARASLLELASMGLRIPDATLLGALESGEYASAIEEYGMAYGCDGNAIAKIKALLEPYAGMMNGSGSITAGGALALSLGIAIQNFPEGAIISMPMYAEGKSKTKSFWLGVLSGIVEPLFGVLPVIVAGLVASAMPYFLSFAAGAMLYVVVEELIPEMSAGKHSNIGVVAFAIGFSLMMVLDVALG